ncbi:MAG: hypothetical protein ACYTBJ_10035 [Planctomycetota bacterium]|jgi:hypothetical protein
MAEKPLTAKMLCLLLGLACTVSVQAADMSTGAGYTSTLCRKLFAEKNLPT